MAIDVRAEIVVARPRDEVTAYVMDPLNDPVWISGIKQARMLTEPPLGKGTRVQRIASFLGKRIEYVLEVEEHDPDALLEMRSVKGPFPMRATYASQEAGDGTLVRIRVRGESGGFYSLAGPLMSLSIKRTIPGDLRALKRLLESAPNKT